MTIEVGASGGGGLIFPQGATALGLNIKEGTGTVTAYTSAGFKTAYDQDHSKWGWESVSLSTSANTTEQTILDITDAGVLTHIIHPMLSGAGTATIRATIDGVVKTFTSETLAIAESFYAGDFRQYEAATTAGDGAGIASQNDYGFGASASFSSGIYHVTPLQTLMNGAIGIIFKTSLKVTIQGSANLHATAAQREAYCSYLTSIPEGLL